MYHFSIKMAGPVGLYDFMIKSFDDLIIHDIGFNIEECYDRRITIGELIPDYETQFTILINQYKTTHPQQFTDSTYILKLWFCDYKNIKNLIDQ